MLTKQMRITDPVPRREFLSCLKKGEVRPEHLTMLVLGHESCPVTDSDREPWSSAILVTPRHAVTKHSVSTRNKIFLCSAEDTIKGKSLSCKERFAFEKRNQGRSRGRDGTTAKEWHPTGPTRFDSTSEMTLVDLMTS